MEDQYKVRWIKIVTDIFDDDKIKIIESMPDGYALIVAWFKILCLAGKSNIYGMLMLNDRIAYSDDMLAAVFRMPLNTVRYALDTFEKMGMIERTDVGAVAVVNWEKHQNVKTLDDMREKGRERTRRFRERQKQAMLSQGDSECNVTCNVTDYVTGNACNADVTDKNKDIENKDIKNNITNVSSAKKRNSYSEDFEKFWSIYPKRSPLPDSKADAYKAWHARLKEGFSSDQMIEGAKRYADLVRRERTEARFIKMAKTFLGVGQWFVAEDDPKEEFEKDDDRIMQEYFDGV